MANSFIGLDVGRARTGFATGNDAARLATPRFSTPTAEAKTKLQELIKEESAAGVVVGLPRNLSGNDTEQTTWIRDWVDKIKPELKLPIYAQDEALTTQLAEAQSKDKPADTDALAAAIILQDFLDSTETERVIW